MGAIFRSPTKASTRSWRRARAAACSNAFRASLLAFAGLAALAGGARANELNRVILRVNDRIVTLYDYRERLVDRERSIRKAEMPPEDMLRNLAAAPNAVLREMMDEVLLLSRGDQLGSEVPESRIDEAVSSTRKNMGLDDDQQWQDALQQYGMTEAEFRGRTRDNLLFQEVLGREVRGKIKVAEEDLQRYYREHPKEFEVKEQFKLRDIVVLEGSGRTDAELAALAAEIEQQLAAGKTLDDLAALYAPLKRTSTVNDLGNVTSGELDKALETAIADVPVKGYSKPAKGRGGLHILQVLERTPAKMRGYSEVQPELEAAERNQRFQAELATYMQDLEKQAYVVANPPAEAANFRGTRPKAPDSGLQDIAPGSEAAAPPAPKEPPAPPPPPPGF
jgi:parvulin-like peptidyl-prolyl isomerase